MPSSPTFVPRSSSLGAYLLCDYRAALDRANIESGGQPTSGVSSAYADLGTLIHYRLQTTIGCVFPKDHDGAPAQAVFDNASTLFNGDPTRTETAIQRAAGLAVLHMPTNPDPSPGPGSPSCPSGPRASASRDTSTSCPRTGRPSWTSRPPAGSRTTTA